MPSSSGRCWRVGLVAALLVGCGSDDTPQPPRPDAGPDDYVLDLPEGFPGPQIPQDNPLKISRVELGRHLFFDERLSGNGTQSCGSCHDQTLAFAQDIPVAEGSTGDLTPRNSPGLTNVAYNTTQTWMNPLLTTLELQHQGPMFGEFPVELGITNNEEAVLQRFRDDLLYQEMFAAAFPDEVDPINFGNIIKAIASFVRTMISGNSPFDKFTYQGQTDALSDQAKRGLDLFFSEDLECHHCHGGFNFTQSTKHEGTVFIENAFHNTGVYNVDTDGNYPAPNLGLFEFTGQDRDRGKFRAPTLRNIAVTGPYLHDGSVERLEDVIRIYEAGGRNIIAGPNAGDGRDNPHKSGFVHGFALTDGQRRDLVVFLESLTDDSFLTDSRFANPFDTSP